MALLLFPTDRYPYGGGGDRDRYPPDRYGSRYPAGADGMGYGRPYDRYPEEYGE